MYVFNINMKYTLRVFYLSLMIVVVSSNFGLPVQASNTKYLPNDYIEGEILVKYRNSKINLNTAVGRTKAHSLGSEKSLEVKENLAESNISVLKIKDTKTVEQKVAELNKDPNVEYAEPNYKRYPVVISTNDTHRAKLWGLDNTGQSVNGTLGTADADIDAPEAWNISETATSSTVIVAIIDTGVAYNHPDLLVNMWDGSDCISESGGALGDCIYGYDFEDGDKTPVPTSSTHGTHIAGTIAAIKNNEKGIVGVAPEAKIMAIKFGLDVATEIKSIDFAIQNGATIINASYGGGGFSQSEYDAIERFRNAGGIFVAAAGNCGDINTYIASGCSSLNQALYPASYDLDNIISVAATNQNDGLASFSNYSATTVDVGAPGVNIYSTVVVIDEEDENQNDGSDELYGYSSGTSMAAPHVAGLAALLWGYNPDLTLTQVRNAIINTGDSLDSLSDKTVSGKRINAYNAIQSVNPAKAITAFTIPLQVGSTEIDEIEKIITVTMPFGTDVTALVPTITITGVSVSPASEVANNFTSTSTYTVTAADGSTQAYSVNVIIAPNPGPTLSSIEITTPADKLLYLVGDALDITGLVITGTYSDASTSTLSASTTDITGFDSSASTTGQVLTITIDGQATTYTVDIVAIPTPTITAPANIYQEANALLSTLDSGLGMATATDETDPEPVITNDAPDTFALGTTTVTWTATNSLGGQQSAIQYVVITDTVVPVITINGNSSVSLTVGDSYTDAGATALDNINGDITSSIVIGGNYTNTATAGTYTVTYNVSDSSGNPATQIVRTITIANRRSSSGGGGGGGGGSSSTNLNVALPNASTTPTFAPVAVTNVTADTQNTPMSVPQFIELLIQIGVIEPDKVWIVRLIFGI